MPEPTRREPTTAGRPGRAPAGLAALAWIALVVSASACGSPSVGPPVAATPITAPGETWTWVGFRDAVCGSGQTTGLGVNLTERSTDVVIYLQGGGACWDGVSCISLRTAVHVRDGYQEAAFRAEPTLAVPAFDRTVAANPLKDMSWVFVPYCTGDLHAGDAVRSYTGTDPDTLASTTITVHHAGGANLDAYLRRLAPTFPGARRVFLMGSSAGGFGAQLMYERVAAAFPEAEVHLLADGAQLVDPKAGTNLWATWRGAWGATLPAACTDCATQPGALVTYLATTYPDRRFALLASTRDDVLSVFFGYYTIVIPNLVPDTAAYEAATNTLLQGRYDPLATTPGNTHYFAVATTDHTMLGGLTTIVGPGGVALSDWVTGWRDGDAAWVSNGP